MLHIFFMPRNFDPIDDAFNDSIISKGLVAILTVVLVVVVDDHHLLMKVE